MRRALSLVGIVLLVACASLPVKQKALVGLQTTETALASAQDFERSLCSPTQAATNGPVTHCDGPNAATIGLTDAVHRTIAGALAKAFRAQEDAAIALQAWQAGQPTPSSVSELQADIDLALTTAKQLLTSPSQQQLITEIQAVADQAATLAKTFTGGAL